MNYLLSIQKDEHPYIAEWFTHHKQFGFDKIVVFNNSSVPYNITDPLYKEIDVSKMGAPQPQCYQYFYDNIMQVGDTATILDGDEFLKSDLSISEIWNKFINCACYTFWGIYMKTNSKKTQKSSVIPINFISLSLPIILIIACYVIWTGMDIQCPCVMCLQCSKRV